MHQRHKSTITADVIATLPNGAFILMRRGVPPFKGYWSIPGGHVEEGETAEQAAVREFKEETGFDVRLDRRIGVYMKSGRDPRGHHINVVFKGTVVGGRLRGSHEGEARIFTHIPHAMAFSQRQILKDSGIV